MFAVFGSPRISKPGKEEDIGSSLWFRPATALGFLTFPVLAKQSFDKTARSFQSGTRSLSPRQAFLFETARPRALTEGCPLAGE